MIQGGQPGLAETLHHGQHRRIDKAEGKIGVELEQLPDPLVVNPLKLGDYDLPCLHVGQKCEEGAWGEPGGRQPFELDDDWRRDNDWFCCFGQESRAIRVIRIRAVEGCVKRTGIANQRQERGA